jgi:hypothetical protein
MLRTSTTPNIGSATFSSYEGNARYRIWPTLMVAAAYDYTTVRAPGRASHYHQVNFGPDYFLSKATDIQLSGIWQHATGIDSTGKAAVATIGSLGASTTPTQIAVKFVLRHRFYAINGTTDITIDPRKQAMPDYQTPSEVRYRIRTPNSSPRRIRVIALTDSDPEVEKCRTYADVEFSKASDFAVLLQRAGAGAGSNPDAPGEWLGLPDIVVISGREGDDARSIAVAAKMYRVNGVTVSVVLSPSRERSNSTADTLRPYSTMMVLSAKAGYLNDLLSALGAQQGE